MLINKGFEFISETDTEVIAQLVEYYYNGDIVETLTKVVERVEGSYALGILCADKTRFIRCRAQRKSAYCRSGRKLIASDVPAILAHTRDVYFLENDEIVLLDAENVKVYNLDGEEIKKRTLSR